jgi:hypothetical protein
MHQDFLTISQVAHNLKIFCNLKVMLRLFYFMLMFEGLNKLIKFSQSWNVLFVIPFML